MKMLFYFLFASFLFVSRVMAQQHSLFTDILNKHVQNGLVNYKELKKDKRLVSYLKQLTNTIPEKLGRNEKLAFWINAYNAFTLQVIVENYPIESINELHTGGRIIGHILGKTVWDREFININNKKYSLNDIEHKILRKMNEPRIHFAIVCASISCPALRNEAFEAEKIEQQLQEEAIKFLNDKARNDFDVTRKTASLSKIFDWFEEDFGSNDEEVLNYTAQFLNVDAAKNIKSNITKWKIVYKDYNWEVNEIK